MSILDEMFDRGFYKKIAMMLKVDEVFTRQALIDGFVLGVRIGSAVRFCKVFNLELLRSQSQFGGPAGFMANLLNDLARACIKQVEQAITPVLPSPSEVEFIPIVSSVDMGMYKTLINDINQNVVTQFAVPTDLLGMGEPEYEPKKNRFERISEEMLMEEEKS